MILTSKPRTRAIATCVLLSTWAGALAAQQHPGTNAPTPLPASDEAKANTPAPILQEPFIDMTTTTSSLPNKPLLATGFVVLGASYGASVVGAALSESETDDKLYYPVVGPWMALNDRDCSVDPCSRKTLDTTLLVGSGVVQGVGALGILLSLVIPQKSSRSAYLIGNDDVHVAPVAGYAELGAVAVGRF